MTTAPEQFSTSGSDGVRIVADRQGDPQARAVVFLHGGGQTRRSWGRAAAAVAKRGWQAVTIDLRGHGESDWSSEGDYRVVSFAADVARSAARPAPKPVLVGASLGGFTSMLLAGETLAGHCQRRRFGRHRAEHGAIRGESHPQLHGRPGGIGVRFTRRGRRRDRRVQPASAPAHRSGRSDHQPAPPRRSLVLALGSAVHQRHGGRFRRSRSPTPIACTRPSRRSWAAACRCC